MVTVAGLRLVEAVKLINEFSDANVVNGFFRCGFEYFRETKQAYYGFRKKKKLIHL